MGGIFRNWDCQKSEGALPKPPSDLTTRFVGCEARAPEQEGVLLRLLWLVHFPSK
jgi:hypothetical protein